MIILSQPPTLRGIQDERIEAIQKYLIQLADELSVSLNNINYTSFDEETQNIIKGG